MSHSANVNTAAPDISVNDYGGFSDENQDEERAAVAASAAETQTVASYNRRRSEGAKKVRRFPVHVPLTNSN